MLITSLIFIETLKLGLKMFVLTQGIQMKNFYSST